MQHNLENPSLAREQQLREQRLRDTRRLQRGRENVYKREQVIRALENLPNLRAALLYGCAPEAEDERVGRRQHSNGDGVRASLICLVADLDMAMSALPGPEGKGIMRDLSLVARLRWDEGATQVDIAHEVGCSRRHAGRKTNIAEERIVGRLCG